MLGGNFNSTYIRWEKDIIIFYGDVELNPTCDYQLATGPEGQQPFDNCVNLAISYKHGYFTTAGQIRPFCTHPNTTICLKFLESFKILYTVRFTDIHTPAEALGDGNMYFVANKGYHSDWNYR